MEEEIEGLADDDEVAEADGREDLHDLEGGVEEAEFVLGHARFDHFEGADAAGCEGDLRFEWGMCVEKRCCGKNGCCVIGGKNFKL